MKSIRQVYIFLILLGMIFVSSCAVEVPTTEEMYPIMEAAAVQPYILAQVTRWLGITNSYTPYTIATNFSVEDATNFVYNGMDTNISTNFITNASVVETNVSTNASTNFITNAYNLGVITADSLDASFSKYSFVLSLKIALAANKADDNLHTTYDSFSNWTTFVADVSNASMCRLTGTIVYTKGGLIMNTVVSNFMVASQALNNTTDLYEGNNQLIDAKGYNAVLDTSNTNTNCNLGYMEIIADGYLYASGTFSNKTFVVPYKNDIKCYFGPMSIGSITNNYESMPNSTVNAYVNFGGFNQYISVKYTGETNYDTAKIKEFGANETLEIDLRKGE